MATKTATAKTRNATPAKANKAKASKPAPKGKAKAKATPAKAKTIVPKPANMVWHGDQVQPPGNRDGNRVGKTTGLVITHFCNELFMASYDHPEVGDTQLAAILKQEFPARAILQTIAAYRSYFNSGKHGFGHGVKLEGEERLPRWGK